MAWIDNLLKNPKRAEASSVSRAMLLLVESLALNAVEVEKPAHSEFQASIRCLGESLRNNVDTPECLVTTGAIIQVLHIFHKSVEQFVAGKQDEYNEIIEILSSSLLTVSNTTGAAAGNLKAIERRIEQASLLQDIRLLRHEMKQAVTLIQDEVRRQDFLKEVATAADSETSNRRNRALPEVDPVTGLANAREAEKAIRAFDCFEDKNFVAVFMLERLDRINDRYGFAAGDELLVAFSQHLAIALQPKDELFRWRGPSFIALLRREESAEMVRTELKQFSEVKREVTITVKGRSISVNLSAASSLIGSYKETPADVLRNVDSFVACRTPNV